MARIGESLGLEERVQEEYQMLASAAAPHRKYLLRPVELLRLPSLKEGHEPSLLVCIYESPGPNDLPRFVDCDATWYQTRPERDKSDNKIHDDLGSHQSSRRELMPLQIFLDFAIGAAGCIKMLHSQQIVHGQIRGDAFHFNRETGCVRLLHLGVGILSHHTGRKSAGWSALANRNVVATNISFMGLKQTGQPHIRPDNRADIYSLGILLWNALIHKTAFGSETPMGIIKEALGQELPSVSSLRPEVPELIARIITKATANSISERYNSVSGLQHDLVDVRRVLATGDATEVQIWQIARKDVSPFFALPRTMVGRTTERDTIAEVLDRIFKLYQGGNKLHLSSLPEGQFAAFAALPSPNEVVRGGEDALNLADGFLNLPASTSATFAGTPQLYIANTSRVRFSGGSQCGSSEDSESGSVAMDRRGPEKRLSAASIDSASGEGSTRSSDTAGRTAAHRILASQGLCELINIEGGAGLGKTRLITSIQIEARRNGFFASSRFDNAAEDSLRPVLHLFSSLFEQAFSENKIEPSFLPTLRNQIGSTWNTLHKVLGLPKFLLGTSPALFEQVPNHSVFSNTSLPYHRHPAPESIGTKSSQEFLRTGSSIKSLPLVRTLLDILRTFTRYKPVCLCLDDVHLADEESLELIAQILSARIRIVVILAYRPENTNLMKKLLDLSINKGKCPLSLVNFDCCINLVCLYYFVSCLPS